MTAKYGARGPFVDVGGLEKPVVAQYQTTIDLMAKIPVERWFSHGMRDENIRRAQYARYQDITRPLSFLGDYAIENPETGGLPVERLSEKYRGIGTAILLSVLEHVEDLAGAVEGLEWALTPGGLVIVSVPFMFPEHASPSDYWRFTPAALRLLFGDGRPDSQWDVLEADWRLSIPANAGVMDIHTGNLQAIESSYIVARRK